ncbi:MAG: 4Fe-4S binding protein [Clostridiales bacterium]|nr:4Fe-4S binding protein [Clostridiales bacterium]
MAKGKVTVAENLCKGCELCVAACPKHILALSKDKLNSKGYHPVGMTDPEECIGCAACATMCPDCALTVERF